eukprot:3562261-Amphidinium_carterae.1
MKQRHQEIDMSTIVLLDNDGEHMHSTAVFRIMQGAAPSPWIPYRVLQSTSIGTLRINMGKVASCPAQSLHGVR